MPTVHGPIAPLFIRAVPPAVAGRFVSFMIKHLRKKLSGKGRGKPIERKAEFGGADGSDAVSRS